MGTSECSREVLMFTLVVLSPVGSGGNLTALEALSEPLALFLGDVNVLISPNASQRGMGFGTAPFSYKGEAWQTIQH